MKLVKKSISEASVQTFFLNTYIHWAMQISIGLGKFVVGEWGEPMEEVRFHLGAHQTCFTEVQDTIVGHTVSIRIEQGVSVQVLNLFLEYNSTG